MRVIYLLTVVLSFHSIAFANENLKEERVGKSILFRLGSDVFEAKAFKNSFIIEPSSQEGGNGSRKYVLVELSDNIDDSKLSFVNLVNSSEGIDKNESFYVSFTYSEIKNIIRFKNMLMPGKCSNNSCKDPSLNEVKKDVKVANFESNIYKTNVNNQDIFLFLSGKAKGYISEKANYCGLIDFVLDMDLESLGVTNLSFDLVKSLLKVSKNKGLVMGIFVLLGKKKETIFQVFELSDQKITKDTFSIPNGLNKRGIESLIF